MRINFNIIAQFISCMMISGITFADSGIMSKYGTIQGVDGYSTNPFWSSNTSTYSNRMPVPVYENGPDVQTDECLKIVSNFVSAQCNALNNCADTSLSDIRPAIILQLSRMSGGNYATSCSGYLDEIFRQYKQAHQTPGASATFPTPSTTAKAATTNTNKSAVPLNNFFDAQKPAWAIEMQERTTELAEFQADNDRFYPELVPMDFPKTYADLSFGERMANNKAGYEPYQGKSAFKPIQVEDLDKYEKRQEQANDKKNLSPEELCKDLIEKIKPLEQMITKCEDAHEKDNLITELNKIKKTLEKCGDTNATEIANQISSLEQKTTQGCKSCPVFEPKYFTAEDKTPTPFQINIGGTTWDFIGETVSSKYKPLYTEYQATLEKYNANKNDKQVCNTLFDQLDKLNTEFDNIHNILYSFVTSDNDLFIQAKDAERGLMMTKTRIDKMIQERRDLTCKYNAYDEDLLSTKTPEEALECAKNYVHYLTQGYIDLDKINCEDIDETTDDDWDDVIRCKVIDSITNDHYMYFVFDDITN